MYCKCIRLRKAIGLAIAPTTAAPTPTPSPHCLWPRHWSKGQSQSYGETSSSPQPQPPPRPRPRSSAFAFAFGLGLGLRLRWGLANAPTTTTPMPTLKRGHVNEDGAGGDGPSCSQALCCNDIGNVAVPEDDNQQCMSARWTLNVGGRHHASVR